MASSGWPPAGPGNGTDAAAPANSPSLKRLVHRHVQATAADDTSAWPHEDYDGSFSFFRQLAPAIALAVTGACMLGMPYAVGYLSQAGEPDDWPRRIADALSGPVDFTARRAALVFSGVTLAITVALTLCIVVWCFAAAREKSPAYRRLVIGWVVAQLAVTLLVLGCMQVLGLQPFTSRLGNHLLYPTSIAPDIRVAAYVPTMMFALACALPAILAMGACFLLQPMRSRGSVEGTQKQLKQLGARLRQLDLLLYAGALALVFGTLQLSAALSVPIASSPDSASLKLQADLCKAAAPNPFFAPGAQAPAPGASYFEGFAAEHCRQLPREFARLEVFDSLRKLARSVTLSFGLAFSAMLVALYVPALNLLRSMIESRLPEPVQVAANEDENGQKREKNGRDASGVTLGDFDPLRRIAAVVAALSPLVAGLVANALAGG